MLSTNSFNALLKTLEEPPPHVKFLLATTDPQKLPATILSRCLQFNLKNMSPERIVVHLQNVLEQEMITYEEPALWLLGRSADGSMRDALSLTDQAISFGSGKLLEADVRSMLGTIDRSAVYEIVEALIAENGAQVLAAVNNMAEHAPDYLSALEELLMLLHRIAIAQAVPDATDNSFGDGAKIIAMSALLTAEDTQLFYQLGLTGRRDLSLAPDLRSGFEMVLLRMLAFKPAGIPQLPERSLTNSPVSVEAPQPVKKPDAGVQSIKADTPVSFSSKLGPAQSSVVNDIQLQADGAVTKAIGEEPLHAGAVSESVAVPLAAPAPVPVAVLVDDTEMSLDEKGPLSLDQLRPDSWNALFERLGFGGVVGNIASHCILVDVTDNAMSLQLDAANATLFSDSYTARIQEHLTVTLNTPVTVKIEVTPLSAETPALRKNRMQNERREAALLSLKNDPNVQVLVSDFDAVLDEASVQPVS